MTAAGDLASLSVPELDEAFADAMAEHEAILSPERVPASAGERLLDLQELCIAILAERGSRSAEREE